MVKVIHYIRWWGGTVVQRTLVGDAEMAWAQQPPSTSHLLCLSNHPALEPWLLQILWGRLCLASLKVFIIRPCVPLRSWGASPASLGSRSHRGGLCFSLPPWLQGPAGVSMEELLFLALSRLCPGHGVQVDTLPMGSREGGAWEMRMGWSRQWFSEHFPDKQMWDCLERIVWKLLLPSAVWPCGHSLIPQRLVSSSVNLGNNSTSLRWFQWGFNGSN